MRNISITCPPWHGAVMLMNGGRAEYALVYLPAPRRGPACCCVLLRAAARPPARTRWGRTSALMIVHLLTTYTPCLHGLSHAQTLTRARALSDTASLFLFLSFSLSLFLSFSLSRARALSLSLTHTHSHTHTYTHTLSLPRTHTATSGPTRTWASTTTTGMAPWLSCASRAPRHRRGAPPTLPLPCVTPEGGHVSDCAAHTWTPPRPRLCEARRCQSTKRAPMLKYPEPTKLSRRSIANGAGVHSSYRTYSRC